MINMKRSWKSSIANDEEYERVSGVSGEDERDENGVSSQEDIQNNKDYERVRGALVAQFAARDPQSFADAVELIHPYVDGVDLNCGKIVINKLKKSVIYQYVSSGCPQGWAYEEQIGCYLLSHPDRVRDIVRAARGRVGWNYPVSVKIRVHDDLRCAHSQSLYKKHRIDYPQQGNGAAHSNWSVLDTHGKL